MSKDCIPIVELKTKEDAKTVWPGSIRDRSVLWHYILCKSGMWNFGYNINMLINVVKRHITKAFCRKNIRLYIKEFQLMTPSWLNYRIILTKGDSRMMLTDGYQEYADRRISSWWCRRISWWCWQMDTIKMLTDEYHHDDANG